MSIEITVRDVANTSPADLKLVIALLQRFAGGAAVVIAAPDLPSVGAPNGDDAADAFQPDAQPAEQAFGGAAASTPEAAFAGHIFSDGHILPASPNAPAAPVAAAAPSTPTNGPAPAPVNAGSTAGQLDSAGLPWDARIHAKTSNGGGKINATGGKWSAKRGVDPMLVVQVEAELRALMGAPSPAAVAAGVSAPVAPPPPGAAPVAPPPPAAAGATTYPQLVQAAGMAMAKGNLTMEEVTAACVKYGVPDMTLIPQRPEFLPFIAADVLALIASRG